MGDANSNGNGAYIKIDSAAMMRLGMLLISGIGLPVIGYLVDRVITKTDTMIDKIGQHDTSLKLIQLDATEIKNRIIDMKDGYADHENRIRALEQQRVIDAQRPRNNQPSGNQ